MVECPIADQIPAALRADLMTYTAHTIGMIFVIQEAIIDSDLAKLYELVHNRCKMNKFKPNASRLSLMTVKTDCRNLTLKMDNIKGKVKVTKYINITCYR